MRDRRNCFGLMGISALITGLVLAVTTLAVPASAADLSVKFPSTDGHYGMALTYTTAAGQMTTFDNPDPLRADVVGNSFRPEVLRGGYDHIVQTAAGFVCRGTLKSANGSILQFTDQYRLQIGDAYQIARSVRVVRVGRGDRGFSTRLSLWSAVSLRMDKCQFFVPGIWYCNNSHLAAGSMAHNYHFHRFIFREDRLPIPLVMLRDPQSGISVAIIHDDPTGGSFVGDQTAKPVCSKLLQFASLGVVRRAGRIGLTILFPGSEGETTYIGPIRHTWVARYNPLVVGYKDVYRSLLVFRHADNFNSAMWAAWRRGWSVMRPSVYRVNLLRIYHQQIELLNHYARRFHGVEGLPFSVALPGGQIAGQSLQIGFVGKQTINAYEMIHYGLRYHDPSLLRKGQAIVNFWVNNSPYLDGSGLFHTWFNTRPLPQWRHYPTYLRIASDGAIGILMAWNAEEKWRRAEPSWLNFCVRYAHWLHGQQHANGSFDRVYSFRTGKPVNQSKSSTLTPVHFLVDLFRATGHHRYLNMAIRAGAYGEKVFVPKAQFFGGALGNVEDKEAGTIALGAFLSLYDVTGNRQWLRSAQIAADYAATWIFAWDVPMDPHDKHCSFPAGRSTIGMSLISTGFSAVDVYMSLCACDYYRLWLDTHDAVYRQIANVLAYDTKQSMAYDGYPHYGFPGLQDEATTIAVDRGWSVEHWLPWITANQLMPLSKLQAIFGTPALGRIEKLPLSHQIALNRAFDTMGGFGSPAKQIAQGTP